MFKIGQKVVCVNDRCPNGAVQGVVKDGIYTIKDIYYCACGSELLILFNEYGKYRRCGDCGRINNHGLHSWRFRPLQYDIISNKDVIKEIIEEKQDVEIKEKEPAS